MTLDYISIGNNMVFRDPTYTHRWVEAIGPQVVKSLNEFVNGNYTIVAGDATGVIKEGWLCTFVEVGAGGQLMSKIAGADGGQLLVTTAGNENDGINMQMTGEACNPSVAAAYHWPFYYGIRFKVSDATESDFIAGMCATDSTLTAGMEDGVYFRSADGAVAIAAVVEKDHVETSTAALDGADDTWMTLEILFNGYAVYFFVNGVRLASPVMDNWPNDEFLTPSFEYLNGAAGSDTVTIDWMRFIQIQTTATIPLF